MKFKQKVQHGSEAILKQSLRTLYQGNLVICRLRTGYTWTHALLGHLVITWTSYGNLCRPRCRRLPHLYIARQSWRTAVYMWPTVDTNLWQYFNLNGNIHLQIIFLLQSMKGLWLLKYDCTSYLSTWTSHQSGKRCQESFAVSQELCGNQPPPKHLSLPSKRRLIKGLPVHLLSEYQINSCTLTISFIGVVVGGGRGEGWVGRASLPTLTYERKWICFVKEQASFLT